MVVALYAGLLALWLIILSMRVIALRGNPAFRWFAFGHNDAAALERAIRGHGNLTEYAPFSLILMLLVEMTSGVSAGLHAYGIAFLLGRLMHGLCFGFMTKNLMLRVGGTVLTLFPILGLAVQLLRAWI